MRMFVCGLFVGVSAAALAEKLPSGCDAFTFEMAAFGVHTMLTAGEFQCLDGHVFEARGTKKDSPLATEWLCRP
jgi:hypothetical protein